CVHCGPVALHSFPTRRSSDLLRAAALLAGVFALSALCSLLGRASGSARTFLALFLVGLYMSISVDKVAPVDVIGFHGAATMPSVDRKSTRLNSSHDQISYAVF